MLLSIGMIVKNEERYLHRCLSALSPILERVESELIIADTGSTDNTVAIAKQFTKDVFHFEWCDDFSAARNSTMKRAKGSWYFWIDADEILADTNEIIDFFNSGEYKQYNSAAITIRSGNDAELKKWIDLQAPRLIKLGSDSCFVNSIHEKYGHIYGPVKLLPVIANHYGYVTQDNEEFIRDKMNRNLKMVLAELGKNPSYCLMYIHASDIYMMLKDYEKALEYNEKGLLHAKEQNSPLESTFLANTVKIYENIGCYAKAIITADEYFRSKEEKLGTDLDVCYLKAESCFLMGRYSEAIQSYLNYFEEYKHGLYKLSNVFQHPVVYADEESYRIATMRLARAYMEEGDFENAAAQLHSLSASNYQKSRDSVPYWLDTEMKLMKKEDYSGILVLYGQLEAAARVIFQSLIEKEIAYPACRDKILSRFKTQSKTDDAYLALFDLRRDYYAASLSDGSVQKFLADTEELKPLYADAAYFAMKLGLPLESVVQKIDASDIGMFFYTNSACHFDDLAYLVYDNYGEVKEGIKAQLWVSSLYYLELTSPRLREVYVPGMFAAYAKTVFAAMAVLFKDEMLMEENAVYLPRQFKVGYYCHMAEEVLEAGKKSEFIHYLRMALKQCPQLGNALKILAEPIQNSIDKEAKKQSEFEVYASKVKAAIKGLIISGKHNEAVELMQQYESLCPDDPEIKSLRERVTHK